MNEILFDQLPVCFISIITLASNYDTIFECNNDIKFNSKISININNLTAIMTLN